MEKTYIRFSKSFNDNNRGNVEIWKTLKGYGIYYRYEDGTFIHHSGNGRKVEVPLYSFDSNGNEIKITPDIPTYNKVKKTFERQMTYDKYLMENYHSSFNYFGRKTHYVMPAGITCDDICIITRRSIKDLFDDIKNGKISDKNFISNIFERKLDISKLDCINY